MALLSGGLIEIADYNDLALEINRLFSDAVPNSTWATSGLILDDTVGISGEIAGATRTFSETLDDTDYIVVIINDVTQVAPDDYIIDTTVFPATITFVDALPALAKIKVYNRTAQSYGWGQAASVYPIVSTQRVYSDEPVMQAYLEANMNNLIDKVNIMKTRTGETASLSRVAPGDMIYATDKTSLTDVINGDILQYSNYWKHNGPAALTARHTFQRTASWGDRLSGTMRYTFGSYDEFRYFFNTGLALRLFVSMTGTSTNQGYNNWNQVCTDMGSLFLGYSNAAQAGIGGTSAGLGIYDLTSSYQTIFTSASPSAPVDINGDLDVYDNYTQLVIVYEARIQESASGISVDIRMTMDDNDINDIVVGTTTVNGGYDLADTVIDNSATFDTSAYYPVLSTQDSFNTMATVPITKITRSNPATITVANNEPLVDGSTVYIDGVAGMTELNGTYHTLTVVDDGILGGPYGGNIWYVKAGKLDRIILTVVGGGGGGGYGVWDNGGYGKASDGTSTTVEVRVGSHEGPILATVTAAGGAGGGNGKIHYDQPHDGEATAFGPGGAGGAINSPGSDAPAPGFVGTGDNLVRVGSFGAGGGGGGGDEGDFWDSSGDAGAGGSAGQTVIQTIDTSARAGQDIYLVPTFGTGGAGAVNSANGWDKSGGAGEGGAVLLGGTVLSIDTDTTTYHPYTFNGTLSYPDGDV